MVIGEYWNNRQRPRSIGNVPIYITIILIVAMSCQVYWSVMQPLVEPTITALPEPPTQYHAQLMSLGDSIAIAKLLMLWLQAFDNQPGISVPFKELDYHRLAQWLESILKLDERSRYPLLAATRLYGSVADDDKKRQMIEFVYRQFIKAPNQCWPELYHAIYIAKHRLKDNTLALMLARAISSQVTTTQIPPWVKQIELYVLEEAGEIESAKLLISNLLVSGVINDKNELRFLQQRLSNLEEQY